MREGCLTDEGGGAQTLERSYLLRINGQVVERPQHMLMRVAIGIHKGDLESAVKTYHLLSERWFTHASPTLFNAGTPRPQLSSCFLICAKNDSIEVGTPPPPHTPPAGLLPEIPIPSKSSFLPHLWYMPFPVLMSLRAVALSQA